MLTYFTPSPQEKSCPDYRFFFIKKIKIKIKIKIKNEAKLSSSHAVKVIKGLHMNFLL